MGRTVKAIGPRHEQLLHHGVIHGHAKDLQTKQSKYSVTV